jgi:hypothetical protein
MLSKEIYPRILRRLRLTPSQVLSPAEDMDVLSL